MEWFIYILVFLAVAVGWFIISRLWVALVDTLIGLVKKIFGFKKKTTEDKWHSLDDIRKNKQQKQKSSP